MTWVAALAGAEVAQKQVQEGASSNPECGSSSRDHAADCTVRERNYRNTTPA